MRNSNTLRLGLIVCFVEFICPGSTQSNFVSVHGFKFSLRESPEERKLYNRQLQMTSSPRSLLECARVCGTLDNCQAFFRQNPHGNCILTAADPSLPLLKDLIVQAWTFYRLTVADAGEVTLPYLMVGPGSTQVVETTTDNEAEPIAANTNPFSTPAILSSGNAVDEKSTSINGPDGDTESTVTPPESRKVDSTVTPPQNQEADSTVTPPESQEVDNTVTVPESREIDNTETPLESHEVDNTVTPPESQEADSTVIPSESQDIDSTVTPPESQEADSTVTPPESQEVERTVTPPKNLEVDSTVSPPELQWIDSTVSPPELQWIDSTVTPPEIQEGDSTVTHPENQKVKSTTTSPENDEVDSTITLLENGTTAYANMFTPITSAPDKDKMVTDVSETYVTLKTSKATDPVLSPTDDNSLLATDPGGAFSASGIDTGATVTTGVKSSSTIPVTDMTSTNAPTENDAVTAATTENNEFDGYIDVSHTISHASFSETSTAYNKDHQPRTRCQYEYVSSLKKCLRFYTDSNVSWIMASGSCFISRGKLIEFQTVADFWTFRDNVIKVSSDFNTRNWHLGLQWKSSDKKWRWTSNDAEFPSSGSDIWAEGYPRAQEEDRDAYQGEYQCASMMSSDNFLLTNNPCSGFSTDTTGTYKRNYICQFDL